MKPWKKLTISNTSKKKNYAELCYHTCFITIECHFRVQLFGPVKDQSVIDNVEEEENILSRRNTQIGELAE